LQLNLLLLSLFLRVNLDMHSRWEYLLIVFFLLVTPAGQVTFYLELPLLLWIGFLRFPFEWYLIIMIIVGEDGGEWLQCFFFLVFNRFLLLIQLRLFDILVREFLILISQVLVVFRVIRVMLIICVSSVSVLAPTSLLLKGGFL